MRLSILSLCCSLLGASLVQAQGLEPLFPQPRPVPMPRIPIVPPIPVPSPGPLKVNPPAMETLTKPIPVMSAPAFCEPMKTRVFEIHDIVCPNIPADTWTYVNSQTANAESLMKLIVMVVKPKTWERRIDYCRL